MRRFLVVAILLIGLCSDFPKCLAQSYGKLMPSSYHFNGFAVDITEFYDVLNRVVFVFENKGNGRYIEVPDGHYGYIICGKDTIAKSLVKSFEQSDGVYMTFDSIKLPTKKYYKAVIPSFQYHKDAPDAIATGMTVDFYVGDTFEAAPWQNNVTFKSTDQIWYAFEIATRCFDDAYALLYRKDKPIIKMSIECWNEDEAGGAICRLPKLRYFEKGIKYKAVIPKGSIHQYNREDIVNEEAVVNVLGNSDHVFLPIEHSSMRTPSADLSSLGSVLVDYATPVQLAPEAKLQLVDAEGSVLKEAVATLSEADGAYTVAADFGDYALDALRDYSICIPEATVVGTGSDITVNERTLVPLSAATLSVGEMKICEPKVERRGSTLYVSGVEAGSRVTVYNASGVLVGSATANTTAFSMPLPQADLLIVKTAGKAFKLK